MHHCRIYMLLLCVATLSACSSPFPTRPDTKTPSAPNTSNVQVPVTPPSTSGGGYYLDDGPGENAPADIDSIPDATLKTEVPLARANKPYSALGQSYTPMTRYAPYKKQGIASWYGKRYHGKKTSTGEIYDMYAMSGAHTILPLPSYVKVTNPANGKSVVVRINDRGPFKHDRLIDLSYAAAYKLRLIGKGSGLVEVEALDSSAEALQQSSSNSQAQSAALPTVSAIAEKPVDSAKTFETTLEPASKANISNNVSAYYVQIGAFKNEANGDLLQKKIEGLNLAENVGVVNVYNNALYRVRLGPYASKSDADISAANIRTKLNISAIVLNQ